ncbi:hypothetical protein OIV83_002172 [Microbotryomycetes sp. JL201]|nr:hypothetical protein OIV83_002172 [Microbotryomycetes sp. JL201]
MVTTVGAPSCGDVRVWSGSVPSWPSKGELGLCSSAGLLTPQTPSRTLGQAPPDVTRTRQVPLPTPSPCLPPATAAEAAVVPVAAPPANAVAARSVPLANNTTTISPLAEFFATMFVYTWYNSGSIATADDASQAMAPAASTCSKLQVNPSDRFLKFMHDVLTTTQVSHSIVLLALLFCSRLKSRNEISGAPGSEFRSSVVALMIANKVLDDNTYTAKTWCDVSGLALAPLIAGEQEFLRGLDWQLHVSDRDFHAWRRLLKGHVASRNEQFVKALARKRSCPTDSLPTAAPLRGLGIGAATETIEQRPSKRVRPDTSAGVQCTSWAASSHPFAVTTKLEPHSTMLPLESSSQSFGHLPMHVHSATSPRPRPPHSANRHKHSSSQTWNAGQRARKPISVTNKHLHADHLQSSMARSRSADCSPVMPPAVHLPPNTYTCAVSQPQNQPQFAVPVWSQITPPEDFVPRFAFAHPSPSDAGQSLADAYSPQTYTSIQPATLGFYTLGAVKGYLDAATSQRPYLPQPNYIPNPLLQHQQHLVVPYQSAYSNAGVPGSFWDPYSGCWRILFSPPMPTYC